VTLIVKTAGSGYFIKFLDLLIQILNKSLQIKNICAKEREKKYSTLETYLKIQ